MNLITCSSRCGKLSGRLGNFSFESNHPFHFSANAFFSLALSFSLLFWLLGMLRLVMPPSSGGAPSSDSKSAVTSRKPAACKSLALGKGLKRATWLIASRKLNQSKRYGKNGGNK